MKMKKIFITVFIALILFISPGFTSEASTVVIKKNDGTDLTYRNSMEKVLRLSEYNYPTSDFRAVWISNFVGDVASYVSVNQYKAEIDSVLDKMELYGLNAMIFHIRIHNDALYNSSLNPIRSYWSTVNFDSWDPLTYIIEESHKRGIEFHAWLNPYRVISSGYTKSLSEYASSFQNSHPTLVNNPAGDANLLLKSTTDGIIMNPGEPVVRMHIYDTIQEIIDNYDVDAIHFDDYFYNNISDTQDNATYNKSGYNPWGLSKANWRREQVNLLMAGIDDLLNNHFLSTGKVVQLGISPTGIYQNAPAGTAGQEHYSALYCDSVAWIQNGWIDYLLPQTYWGFEHSVAGFAQLTRYWNNVVKGYDVNMYMGHGIYMAPGSGWENSNEIKNRLLNMAMYDRLDGSAFYKYGTFSDLNNANNIIQQGFNLLKNDYWSKKVPGSVVRSYANLVPCIQVSNINVQTISNQLTIRWQKIDNVRGYIVYQVLKNQVINQNNINHLYKYIQTNEITVNDYENYDYYISSVNLANVSSTPTFVDYNVLSGYQAVIDGINALPIDITLNDELTITNLRNAFNQLSSVEQSQVINLDILVRAEGIIKELKELKTIVDDVINRTSKHIISHYQFPTSSLATVSWSYKDNLDPVHDLITGRRLKEKLLPYLDTLILKATKNNLSYQTEVVINFGILSTEQIGHFYRNSASALSADEEGPYISNNHIGWEKKTLTFGNQVLFIALGNYVSITDANLKTVKWSSCGTVYHNQTSYDITFLASNSTIRTDVSTYGYLIIGTNNKVRVTPMDAKPDSYITLKAGEILYAPNYLESQMTGSLFVPVTNIAVNSTAYLTDYEKETNTPQEDANQIILSIEALISPDKMTLDIDTLPYVIARANYEALSSEAKALVTNLQKLIDCENKLLELLDERLVITRNQALVELEYYENNLNLYSSSNQVLITNIVNSARNNLNQAKTIDEINQIMTNIRLELNSILTIDEEAERDLMIKRSQATLELQNYVNLDNYSTQNQNVIRNLITDAINFISDASLNEIDQIVIDTKTLIDNVKTIDEEAEILLTNAKTHAKNILNDYVNLSNYSLINQELIQEIINNGIVAIDSSLTPSQVQQELNNAKNLINQVKTLQDEKLEVLEGQKELAKAQLESYPNYEDYSDDNQRAIRQLINTGKVAIDNALSQKEIDEIVEGIKLEIDKIPMIDSSLDNVKILKKQELDQYVNLNKYSTSNQTKITQIINDGKEKIDNAKTVEEINQALSDTKVLIDVIEKLPSQTVNCNNFSTYFISIIVVLCLAIIIQRKAR